MTSLGQGLGHYWLEWTPTGQLFDVYLLGGVGRKDQHICQVLPYKGIKPENITDPKQMYTVKAKDYPGIGNLEQMVKGSDLLDYIDSIRRGRCG
jgi:hypothetical protein